jgi:hypothetical protein
LIRLIRVDGNYGLANPVAYIIDRESGTAAPYSKAARDAKSINQPWIFPLKEWALWV